MKYKIETKNEKIYIIVTLDDSGTGAHPKPRERIKKRDILKILKKENIKHGECVGNPGALSNFENMPSLTKTWIFETPPRPKPKPKPKKRSYSRKPANRAPTNKNEKKP